MDDTTIILNDIENWYDRNVTTYRAYTKQVVDLLDTIIRRKGVPFHSITSRVKDRNSYIEKCKRKNYKVPSEDITDFAGIRIIAYTLADVKQISSLVENEFTIDRNNSMDKAELLSADKVGYLSIHYVAQLSQSRTALIEYSFYSGLKCEIQIRTLLQHAWAEIEHDRSYKFSGVLPIDIDRRFHLVAGVLEIMDYEFQRLSDEIDRYVKDVQDKTKKGELDIDINSTSLIEFLQQKLPKIPVAPTLKGSDDKIIQELKDFGILKIYHLNAILSEDFFRFITELYNSDGYKCADNYIGLLRILMIFADSEKYFKEAWKNNWGAIEKELVALFNKYGVSTEEIKNRVDII